MFSYQQNKNLYLAISSTVVFILYLVFALQDISSCFFLEGENNSLGLSFYYTKVIVLNFFEIRNQEQLATIETMQNDFKVQSEGLLALQSKNQEIQAEMNRYLDIFKRHDLTKLAAAKPGLIEPRVNNGTKKVFESIEEDSRNIDSLNNGLQLQSNP